MNRKCYRIIFNKKRDMLMVVAATTASMMALPSAHGQIVADPSAPSNQQPTIVNTANGLPQVNIQTPSAGGVSRNTYSQFDVQQAGAILNNARTDVQTQLGGWIQGNANLANGGARIILNEVNSVDPSYLRGYLEVAGDRAQVIIANPSGISCDGCGFINASRATLTSGTAVMEGSNLEGYRVRRGMVSVQGAGLDSRNADYTDIIARAVQVNAGIWGKVLKVTAGANEVDAAHTKAIPIAPEASKDKMPLVGIDVAQLGGMYANKIMLVGTGAGVGVSNAGEIGAAAGDVIVRADGTLVNSGHIDSTQAISLAAAMLDNRSGHILASGDIDLAVAKEIDNSNGQVSAGAGLVIRDATSAKTLLIKNTDGALIAGRLLDIDSAGLSGDGRLLSDKDLALKLRDDFVNTGTVQANGMLTLEVEHALVNLGKLHADDALSLKAANIDNLRNGEITAAHLDLTASGILNNRGLIDAQNTFIDADDIKNLGTGRLYGDHIAIAARSFTNASEAVDGTIDAPIVAARDRLDIAAQTIDNRQHATLFSLGDMAIGGRLDDSRHAIGQAGTLDNHSATIEATGSLDLSAEQINNINDHFSTELVEVSRQPIREYQLAGSTNRYRPDQIKILPYEADYLSTLDGGGGFRFHRYDYTRVIQDTKISETDPAKILSGGAMRISADNMLNDKSTVIAGGTLFGDIGKLNNTQTAGQRVISDSGTATYFYDVEKRGRDEQGMSVAGYDPAQIVQATSLTPTIYKQNTKAKGGDIQIATRDTSRMDTPIVLPDSSLFIVKVDPGLNYLVQTDPRFTDRRNWLSSDYLLQKMKVDPATMQKRLGDGYYEQKLVREQIAELTGRRFLKGYASDETQYRALLDSGAKYAKKMKLRVGVALSAKQMAQLTSDVVLLIEKTVTLPDGKPGKVLVPQLYTRVKNGDINGAGALILGTSVDLDIRDDVTNSGTISGSEKLLINTDDGDIHNLGGRISAAEVTLTAGNDIDNIGGSIDAADSLKLAAGRDLNVVSSTRVSQSAQGMGATSVLSNTAQYLLDNNLGYTVPHSKQAEAFLQTLQSEYAAISPNLSIGDGQYLFYATADQKSDSNLNTKYLDKEIAGLISKTSVLPIEVAATVDRTRDIRTGLPLDDHGRYSEQAYVNGSMYQPKYFPCAVLQCQDHNLDMSDAGTQAYVKAVDIDILKKIGVAANLVILKNPVGIVGNTSSFIGSAAGIAGGVIEDSLPEAAGTEVLEYAAEMYLRKVYSLPKSVAVRAITAIDMAGGWDAFVTRTSNYLFDDGV